MEINWTTEVTQEPAWTQEVWTIPQKGESIQNILDGVEWTPCEIFDIKKKERALKFLTNPGLLRDKEYSNVESWQEYFHSLSSDPAFMDLKEYYNLWYINDEEIMEVIEGFSISKSMEFDLFIAITETLMPQEVREAQGGISEDDSAILFDN